MTLKGTAFKLQGAINSCGGCILIDKSQFYSKEKHCPMNFYRVCAVDKDEQTEFRAGKKICLYETGSTLKLVFFLRDYWCVMNGQQLPKPLSFDKYGDYRAEYKDSLKNAQELYIKLQDTK